MLPLSVTFDDVYEQRFEQNATKEDPGTPVERAQYSIEKSDIAKLPIGAELGYRMMPYNHWYGGYIGIGMFPGIKGNSNQYFIIGIQAYLLGKFKYTGKK